VTGNWAASKRGGRRLFRRHKSIFRDQVAERNFWLNNGASSLETLPTRRPGQCEISVYPNVGFVESLSELALIRARPAKRLKMSITFAESDASLARIPESSRTHKDSREYCLVKRFGSYTSESQFGRPREHSIIEAEYPYIREAS